MVHIADTKVATRFSDFFIRQIQKINEVINFDLGKRLIIFLFKIDYFLKDQFKFENDTKLTLRLDLII